FSAIDFPTPSLYHPFTPMEPTVLLSYRKTTSSAPVSGSLQESSSREHGRVTDDDMERHCTGKTSPSSDIAAKMTCHPKGDAFEVSQDKFTSRPIQLSSSFSTAYASSASSSASTTSEEELPTARRYSDSN